MTEVELIGHCKPLIANCKRSNSIDLRFTPLPLSEVGKILNSQPHAPFWAGRSRLFG